MKKLIIFIIVLGVVLSAYGGDNTANFYPKKEKKVRKMGYVPSKVVDTLVINGLDTIISRETLLKEFKNIAFADTITLNGVEYKQSVLKQVLRKNHRDSVRAYKNLWISILGGPSYTPEASLGIGGAALMTFKTNKKDPNLMRSFIPVGFNVSINGTFVLAGNSCIYLNENRFRIYSSYGFRIEPANFYGVGYQEAEDAYNSGADIEYHKQTLFLRPIFLWDVWKSRLFLGPMFDVTYNKGTNMSPFMESNPTVIKYGHHFTNIGVGVSAQFDTRDNESFPLKGMYAIFKAMVFPSFIGNKYSYGYISTEFRHYVKLFNRRSTFAYTLRLDNSIGEVPYTSLSTFGSPFDLRGYITGKYRDKNMAYAIGEYRHMFGTPEQYERRAFVSRLGAAVWVGAGSIAAQMKDMTRWNINYGVGLRYEIQPYKNFRFDVGRGFGKGNGWLVYFNMTEAF